MITEICCCTIVFVIVAILLLRLLGRTYIVYPRQQPARTNNTARPQPGASQEINMVRCGHCGTMYAETLPGCPKCGGS